jgi:hypothetical protein
MIEKQYESVKSPSPDEYVTYPEFSTVQLLLPCFVASFLDLSIEKGVSQATKDLYVRFINRLIRSYEQQPVAQKQFESRVNLTLFEHIQSEMKPLQKSMAAKFNIAIKLMLRDSKVANIITGKCMHYLNSCDAQQRDWEQLSQLDHWFQIDCAWYSHVLMFLERGRDSLLDCGLLRIEQMDQRFYCGFQLAWSLFSKKRDELRLHINDHVDFRTHQGFIDYFRNDLIRMEGHILKRVPVELRDAAKYLTLQQLQSLNIYYYIKDLKNPKNLKLKFEDQLIFPPEDFGKIVSALKRNNLLGLKLQMASERNAIQDFSLVPYRLAKTNLYYKEVMRSVTPSGKVTMKSPGEITFCPIKHCRWCGQADVKQFRVCPECKDNLDYPDLNFFCSETCEKQCLEKQHIEEHAKYFMMLIGLDD